MPTPQEIDAAIKLLVDAGYDQYRIIAAGPKMRSQNTAAQGMLAARLASEPVSAGAHPFMHAKAKAFALLDDYGELDRNSDWRQSHLIEALRQFVGTTLPHLRLREESSDRRAARRLYEEWQSKKNRT